MGAKLKRVERKGFRCVSIAAFIFILLGLSLNQGYAQEKFPTKPINYVVGFAAGGASEVSSRVLANAAAKILGQPVIINVKPGGGSSVAVAGLKLEKPDGYNIGLLPTGAVMAQHFRKLTYDTAKDFTPIMQYAVFSEGVVARSDAPWKTFKDFVAHAKANPGKLRYGTSGPTSPAYMVMSQLAVEAGVKWTHIPFEGTANAVTALLGGHIEAEADSASWQPHVESGRLRLLAAFSNQRMSFAPDVPTVQEMGYKIFFPSLISVVGPKGIPPETAAILHTAFKKALEDPEVLKVFQQIQAVPTYRGPEELAKHLVDFNEKVENLIVKFNLRK